MTILTTPNREKINKKALEVLEYYIDKITDERDRIYCDDEIEHFARDVVISLMSDLYDKIDSNINSPIMHLK